MAKKFVKDVKITTIESILLNPHRHFCLIYKGKEKYIDYNTITNMTFKTVVDSMKNDLLYFAKVIITEKIKSSKPREVITPKVEGIKSTCKTDLDKLYE